jgi:glutamine synthetase
MDEQFDRLRVLWPDHLGLARGKYVPARMADRGARHCTGVWALGYNREMEPGTTGSNYYDGLPDMVAQFDPAQIRPGWEDRTGVVVADLAEHGEPVTVSPRAALRRAVAAWQDRGLQPMAGIELEAFLLESDGAGGWRPLDTPGAFVYGTGTAVDPGGVIDEIWAAADRAGLPVEAINSEYDTPQFEFTLEYTDALRAADEAFLFKVLAREVTARRGLVCTFLGKPLSDRGGSGLHVNLSMTAAGGSNAFDDPAGDHGMSDLARRCVAGLLEHHEALAGLLAPTVNAYKRLQPGALAGCWANWGYDHRGATVRIPGERGRAARIEHRLADGAAPPHIAVAAVLQAALLGVTGDAALPPAETGDGLEHVDTERCVPPDLGAALNVLEADKALCAAIGADLTAQHISVKRAEWRRYCQATTDWELREYLPFL